MDMDTIWDTPSQVTTRFQIIAACRTNHSHVVNKLLPTVEWTPLELMIMICYGKHRDSATWDLVYPLLTPDDVRTTFYVPDYTEPHTLLTYCCAVYTTNEELLKHQITYLLRLGADWNQVVGEKTALSYLVTTDYHIDLILWCCSCGASLHHGHLFIHASNWMTEAQYQQKQTEIQLYYDEIDIRDMVNITEPDIMIQFRPYTNDTVFTFLIDQAVNVNDVLDNGMTPLLSACCEGNLVKVHSLLYAGASMYATTKEGISAWTWSVRHYDHYMSPLRNLLEQHEERERVYWMELVRESMYEPSSLLHGIPLTSILDMVCVHKTSLFYTF